MQRNLTKDGLERVPVTTAYVFSTRPDSPLLHWLPRQGEHSCVKPRPTGEGHRVVLVARGFDRRDVEVRALPGAGFCEADLSDVNVLTTAFEGCDTTLATAPLLDWITSERRMSILPSCFTQQ